MQLQSNIIDLNILLLHLKSHIFTFTFDISKKLGVKHCPHLTLRGCQTEGKPNNLQLWERVSRCRDVNTG